ncbi:MAG: hypothetical protein LBC65_04325, partial [Oscillospiraceae bacterium]|nr:hypothetical protein [Oscillospiraceae bacterium]
MNTKILLIALIAVVAIATGVLSFILLGDRAPAEPVKVPEVDLLYSPGDYFLTDMKPNKDGSVHIVRVTMMLHVNSEEYFAELEHEVAQTRPRIREAILFALRKFSAEEL